jgi:hypothetical protein
MTIITTFGAPKQVSASTYVRRLDHGLLAGAVGFTLGAVAVTAALWHPLPGLAGVPPGGAWSQFWNYPDLLLNTCSNGWFFPRAWDDNPAFGYTSFPLHARLLPGWLAGLACAYRWGKRALTPTNNVRHVAGPQLFEGKHAEQEGIRYANELRGGKKVSGLARLHPCLDLPKRTWCRHVLVVGAVGAGKTQIIYPIVRQFIRKRKKTFILDVKGDYTGACRGMILSPWDARSVYWDLAADCRTTADADAFAGSIIPKEEGANAFFSNAARLILVGTLRFLQARKDDTWTWSDLDVVLSLSAKHLAPILREHYLKAHATIAGSEVTTGSVLASLSVYTAPITQLAEAWGVGLDDQGQPRRRLSLTAWVKDDYQGERSIIAQAGPDPELTRRYLAAVLNTLVPAITSNRLPDDVAEDGRLLAFVLDELCAIGRIQLEPLITVGRSKGVCCILGVQHDQQVADVYTPTFASILPSIVGTHIYGQLQAGPARDKVSEMFKQRVAITTTTESQNGSSTSTHEEMRAVMPSSDFTEKLGYVGDRKHRDRFSIRAIASFGRDLFLLSWPGMHVPVRRLPFDPAKWTLPGYIRDPAMANTSELEEDPRLLPDITGHVERSLTP